MLILHAGLVDDALHFWGEVRADEAGRPRMGTRKRARRTAVPPPHPCDAGDETLAIAIAEVALDWPAESAKARRVVAWLPTRGERPVASHALVRDETVAQDSSKTTITLAPWSVTAFALPAPRSLEMLCYCAGKELLAPGVVAGDDLRFWVTAMRFAGALVAKQQVLPAIGDTADGGVRACW